MAALAAANVETPSLSLSADIRLRPGDREAFLNDLRSSLQSLREKYGGAEGEAFRLAFACYLKGVES